MDKLKPQGSLGAIEQNIVEGKKVIARQREIVDSLRRHGCDTREAEKLLMEFEERQAMHLADKNRLASNSTIRSLL
jgi:hypothetical protein